MLGVEKSAMELLWSLCRGTQGAVRAGEGASAYRGGGQAPRPPCTPGLLPRTADRGLWAVGHRNQLTA